MAIFGNTAEQSIAEPLTNVIVAMKGTPVSSGVGVGISFFLNSWHDGNYKVALHKTSDNSLIANSVAELFITSTGGVNTWKTINFGASKPIIVNGIEHYIDVWSDSISGATLGNYEGDGTSARQSLTYDGYPDPLVPVSYTQKLSIYCTYTEGGEPSVFDIILRDPSSFFNIRFLTPSYGWKKLAYLTEPPSAGWNKLAYESEPPVPSSWNKIKQS